jgi:periplasmic protein TonB
MKLLLLPVILLSFVMIANGQSAKRDSIVRYSSFDPADDYPGGRHAWLQFLDKNFKYPDDAVNKGIDGTVYVQFAVNVDSTISDVHAISGPTGGGLRQEAVETIKLSGKWIPAIENGIRVKCFKRVPLVFHLDKP